MNLYYVTHPYKKSYDCYIDMVIAAETEEEARLISVKKGIDFCKECIGSEFLCDYEYCSYCISNRCVPYWDQGLPIPEEFRKHDFKWVCEEALKVGFLGIAADGIKKGVIIASNKGS